MRNEELEMVCVQSEGLRLEFIVAHHDARRKFLQKRLPEFEFHISHSTFLIRLCVTVIPEPAHRLFKRYLWRGLRDTQFSDRLTAIVVHLVFRHLHPF